MLTVLSIHGSEVAFGFVWFGLAWVFLALQKPAHPLKCCIRSKSQNSPLEGTLFF